MGLHRSQSLRPAFCLSSSRLRLSPIRPSSTLGRKMKASTMAACLTVLLLVAAQAPPSASVTCNPSELSSCASALFSGAAPSGQCCGKLREQRPCLCGYASNPAFGQYLNSPNAKKMLTACRVSIPRC